MRGEGGGGFIFEALNSTDPSFVKNRGIFRGMTKSFFELSPNTSLYYLWTLGGEKKLYGDAFRFNLSAKVLKKKSQMSTNGKINMFTF